MFLCAFEASLPLTFFKLLSTFCSSLSSLCTRRLLGRPLLLEEAGGGWAGDGWFRLSTSLKEQERSGGLGGWFFLAWKEETNE
ncbi:hypothetical protein BpHYR1_048899 [Brachionus plicatilis]|uniref:Uncharacterized protein n=1 Tax=Brachionus plicatilis TaxID=10195 RepID=A0A3M7SRV8_BRAPC|nr:hypothetical protein BpHYR1_048899 [Brachionus plicatilis]